MERKFSVKSDRTLQQLGVLPRLRAGERVVPVGKTFALRGREGEFASLVFAFDGDTLAVGYATRHGESWTVEELEPYSLRALGYWQRWLKRHGEPVDWPE
jgi:hypothetical protein